MINKIGVTFVFFIWGVIVLTVALVTLGGGSSHDNTYSPESSGSLKLPPSTRIPMFMVDFVDVPLVEVFPTIEISRGSSVEVLMRVWKVRADAEVFKPIVYVAGNMFTPSVDEGKLKEQVNIYASGIKIELSPLSVSFTPSVEKAQMLLYIKIEETAIPGVYWLCILYRDGTGFGLTDLRIVVS
ncbi:MAG: hypothetical protein QW304_09000 [Thermoproteota archaeon]